MTTLSEIRSVRVFDLALFDLLLAFIGTEYVFRYLGASPYVGIILAVFIGIIIHYWLNIPTTLNYKLGLSELPKDRQHENIRRFSFIK